MKSERQLIQTPFAFEFRRTKNEFRVFHCLLLGLNALIGLPLVANADDDAFDRDSVKVRDTIQLKSDLILKGELVREETEDGKTIVVFRTLDGIQVRLDKDKMIRRIELLDDISKRYNQALATMKDTAEDHHGMVTWCEAQDVGKRFEPQIEFHRRRIMQLDPNDARVRNKLGYEYEEAEGRWVHEQQYWDSRGYVREGAGWIPKLQQQINGRSEDKSSLIGDRKADFNKWKRLAQRNPSQALPALQQITDVAMLPVLYERIQEESNPEVRAIYAEAFGLVPHPISVNALVAMWINEGRERTLDLLKQDSFRSYQTASSSAMARFLIDPNRQRVLRAAQGIAALGSEEQLLPLIDALVTTHLYKQRDDPGRMTSTFANPGGINQGGINQTFGENSGPQKVQTANNEVLDALKVLTEQDFGFDKALWRKWYLDTYSTHDLPIRPDRN